MLASWHSHPTFNAKHADKRCLLRLDVWEESQGLANGVGAKDHFSGVVFFVGHEKNRCFLMLFLKKTYTPWKINMEPKNGGLEADFLLCSMLIFGGVGSRFLLNTIQRSRCELPQSRSWRE